MNKRPLLLIGMAVALLALLVPATGSAAKGKKKKKGAEVTVMTRNLYLGADLGPAISAGSIPEAIDAAGTILNDVDLSNFPERSKLLAAEIADAEPDFVGLQEVALWRDQTPSDYTATPATNVRYDFLQLLMDQLKAQGAKYKVAVVQEEFDQELPGDVDHNDATGNGPLAAFGADLDGRLTMRDVILVRKDKKLKFKNPQMGHFENTYNVSLGGVVPIKVDRGWVSIDAKVKGDKKRKSAKFKFVNAHFEAFGDPAIREAQAREMIAGPLKTKKQLIFLGDINSGGPEDHIGSPYPGDPNDPLAYNALVNEGGLINLGARQTCCYPDVFAPEIGSYRFDHTVDHVFVKPKLKQTDAYVTGDDPTVTGAGGVVASDHGGLVSTLKFKAKKGKKK